MNYLVIPKTGPAFYTNWYDYENNYVEGMTIIDLYAHKISNDGKKWEAIEEDSL